MEPIAWWVWLLIWTGLVLFLLAVLALGAWWLFRKFMTLLDDVGDLAERGVLLQTEDAEFVRRGRAILAEPRAVRERESDRRSHRIARRDERYEARLRRARAITKMTLESRTALVASARERWAPQRSSE